MLDKLEETAVEGLEKLYAAVQNAAPEVWEAAAQKIQADVVTGWIFTGTFAFVFLFSLCLYVWGAWLMSKDVKRKCHGDCGAYDTIVGTGPATGGLIMGLISLIATITMAASTIHTTMSAKWQAIQLILEQVR